MRPPVVRRWAPPFVTDAQEESPYQLTAEAGMRLSLCISLPREFSPFLLFEWRVCLLVCSSFAWWRWRAALASGRLLSCFPLVRHAHRKERARE